MKIIGYSEAEAKIFSGDQVKGATGRVLIGRADGAKNFCMRLFELDPDGYTPKHTHDWEHEIFVHSGEGVLFKEGELVPVRSGTAIFIPPNEEHQLKNTGTEPFMFVCLIPAGYPEI
ncbi:MAG: cupin domain-containing protein [Syntrophobacteraceae bacterium]